MDTPRFSAVAGAVLMVVAALVTAPPGGAAPSGGDDRSGATTPVLSARRVPALVQSVVARPSLAAELDAVVAAGPGDTCLDVRVDGRALYRRGEALSLIPASNQKVVTARLATEVLGPDHRFRTEVAGSLAGDTVDGDLYLVGGGDPVLRTDAYAAYFADDAGTGTSLEKLADAVVDAGVRRVTGSVIGDESRYDDLRSVPGWPDRYLEQHQLGPLSALAVNQGFVSFPPRYSEEGLALLEPAADPASSAAAVFADLLGERGVRIEGPARVGERGADVPEIASVTSPPLTEVIAQLLNRSDNQISELLVKEAGVAGGGPGTTAAGLEAFAGAFDRLGLPANGVVRHDGSGLGYDNRLTCGVLADILDDAGATSAIADGLAVAGETGTLRERFTDDDLRGTIRAKTGSLNDVTSLSGFAAPAHAPPVVFAYIANGAPVTPELLALQERLGRALDGYGAGAPLDRLGPR